MFDTNEKGFFPAPEESKEAFLQRTVRPPPYREEESLSAEARGEANQLTQKLFGFSADWFVAYYSDKDLPFWQGAVAWTDENGTPFVQLRKGFKKGSYLKFYSRREVLAHEAVHAVRMGFHEPRFEEFLAYKTSLHRWRRFLGPLFRYSWEPSILFVLLLLSLTAQLLLFSWEQPLLQIIIFLPWLYLAVLFLRLLRTHWAFRRYLQKVRKAIAKPQQALALALRLTDREIALFSKSSPEEISEYIQRQQQYSFRWKFLKKLYF